MDEAKIIEEVRASMSEKRFRHTEGCVKMAEALARKYGEDVSLARRAAYLHDITKEMPHQRQLKMADEFGIILTDIQKSEKIIHAFTGAIVAEHEFGEGDAVCGAVRWHTTAREGMTGLEKIIWISDLTEENRTFPGVEKIRKLAFENIDDALICGFDATLSHLIETGSEVDINMVQARNFEIKAKKGKSLAK